jgi:hypothetical protein
MTCSMVTGQRLCPELRAVFQNEIASAGRSVQLEAVCDVASPNVGCCVNHHGV